MTRQNVSAPGGKPEAQHEVEFCAGRADPHRNDTPPAAERPSPPDESARERFLGLLADDLIARRNPLAQLHHQAARRGAKKPAEVRAYVRLGIRERMNSPLSSPEERSQWRRVRELLEGHLQEWFDYALYVLAFEALPQAEKDARKARRGEIHRQAWLQQQAPTEKQIDFLRALGHTGPVENRAEASRLIDHLLAGRRVADAE